MVELPFLEMIGYKYSS